ncbi:MAG: RNA polymerase sigma factor, partial [Candidatus Brocadiia bacterium]|nr:RNA polymerase sigma factor [Candidatus Brocadiia bacterium]
DVVQEAVVEGYRQVRRFRGEASLGTWLGRIVIRKAMRASKQRNVAREVDVSEVAPDEAQRIAVREAVARLPSRLRAPVVLRFYEGLSGDEIAALLDSKPSTVWTRLYRGLKRLREDLGEETLP